MPQGIFRYKNQAGIETNPIEVENEVITWQAKFYTTKLSDNKAELIKCIEKTNKYYQNTTKLLIFSNQEWSQSYKKDDPDSEPIEKKEIEDKANKYGIIIEWRLASYLESESVCSINADLTEYYFSNNALKITFKYIKNHT